MPAAPRVIHIDPEILGGTPVFVETRVPFQALTDYLESGHPLADFLEDFPTVTPEQALAALKQADRWTPDFLESLGAWKEGIDRPPSLPVSKVRDPFQ